MREFEDFLPELIAILFVVTIVLIALQMCWQERFGNWSRKAPAIIVLVGIVVAFSLVGSKPWISRFEKEVAHFEKRCNELQNTNDLGELGQIYLPVKMDLSGDYGGQVNPDEVLALDDIWEGCMRRAAKKFKTE